MAKQTCCYIQVVCVCVFDRAACVVEMGCVFCLLVLLNNHWQSKAVILVTPSPHFLAATSRLFVCDRADCVMHCLIQELYNDLKIWHSTRSWWCSTKENTVTGFWTILNLTYMCYIPTYSQCWKCVEKLHLLWNPFYYEKHCNLNTFSRPKLQCSSSVEHRCEHVLRQILNLVLFF